MKRIIDQKKFDWNEFFNKKGKTWRDKDYRFLKKHFPLHTLKGSLLDVGCGVGDGIRYLKSICPHITDFHGMDSSIEAIKINRKNPEMKDVTFYEHSIELDFFGQFDNVICVQVLEHLQNPEVAIQNLIKATKQNLLISTPNQNARPDSDHKWSFEVEDFIGISEDVFIGENNIYCGVYKDDISLESNHSNWYSS
jgi:2-polyprenyl-3-methyl-5-hydroxy-6-metoxy-1,4-benzoquinol methylase